VFINQIQVMKLLILQKWICPTHDCVMPHYQCSIQSAGVQESPLYIENPFRICIHTGFFPLTALYFLYTNTPHFGQWKIIYLWQESKSENWNKLKVTYAFYLVTLTRHIVHRSADYLNDVNHFCTVLAVVWESEWALLNWFYYQN
jgi:hypothetical protein